VRALNVWGMSESVRPWEQRNRDSFYKKTLGFINFTDMPLSLI
jgi:hypothetical protein